MASSISVQPLPSRNPDPSTAKTHHVGSPPTRFKNPWPSFKDHGKWDVLQLRFGTNAEKNFVPVPEGLNGARSDELVQVRSPTWGADQRSKLRATWIGHASWLIETPAQTGADRGVKILFDPVFSERTSPFSFIGPKRYTPTPCTLGELPDVDIICISHNHYDHLDIDTVLPLYKRLKGKVHFFVPLGVKRWFLEHVGTSPNEVTEMDWWEGSEVQIQELGRVKFTFCPSQHVSGRTLWDAGKTLWGSWVVETGDKKVYFAGDTAYQAHETPSPNPVFEQIGSTFGPFDLSLIPIGLYSPEKFAASVHVHPEQSLVLHKAVRSKLSLGMHYGTVRGGLSAFYEDVRDPPRRWRKAAEKECLWRGGGIEGDGSPIDVTKEGVGLCHIGETVAV